MNSTKRSATASVISFKAGIRAAVHCSRGERRSGLYDDATTSAIAACAFRSRAYRNTGSFVKNFCDAPIMLRAAF